MKRSTPREQRPGYVLLIVLIVVTVLSLAAYNFMESMTSQQVAAQRTTEAAQARAFAISGLHYAAANLADLDAYRTTLGGNPFNNPDVFQSQVVSQAADNPRKEGRFAIVHAFNTGDSNSPTYETRYGVIDEGGKININAFIQFDKTGDRLHDALMQLPNMTEDVADAIVDWVDADDNSRPSGAETAAYTELGYKAKNGPLNSLDELLLVRGVTVDLLYGTDRNRNGQADDGAQELRGGLADYLTVWGRELNTDSEGDPRVYVNGTEDLPLLYEDLIQAVGQEMADYVMAYRLFGGSTVSNSTTGGTKTSSRLPLTRNYVQTLQRGGGGAPPSGGSSKGGSPSGSSGSGGMPSGGSGGSSSSGRGGESNSGRGGSTGGSSGSSGSSKGGSKGGSSSGSTATPAPIIGTAQDLQGAVQTALAGQNVKPKSKLRSLAQLINTQVTLPKKANAPQNAPSVIVLSPLNDVGKRDQMLPTLMDKLTTQGSFELPPRINVNTASREVLLALVTLSTPSSQRSGSTTSSSSTGSTSSTTTGTGSTGSTTGSSGTTSSSSSTSSDALKDTDVDAIISARGGLSPSDESLASPAWLITLGGIKPAAFQRIERYITTRSSVYRVQSIGYFGEGGPVARVEAVIDTNQGSPRFLSFRDLTDLDTPRGFEPSR